MATRGTYEIDGRVFYCHWDNYPEGAAKRFTKMLKCKHGDLAARFMRGNQDSELTESVDSHGDTEYTYRIWRDRDGMVQIIWHERMFETGEWGKAHIMTLSEYMGSFGQEDGIEPCSPKGRLLEDVTKEHDQFMQSIGEAVTSNHYEISLPSPGDWLECYRYFNWFETHKVSIGGFPVMLREVNTVRLDTARQALSSREFMVQFLNNKVRTTYKDA